VAAVRRVLLALYAAFFLAPIAALAEFSTRGTGLSAARTLRAWRSIATYPELTSAIRTSLELAVLTTMAALALVVPTLVWVRLRLPALTGTVEYLCLLPLTIPAIALVVGLVPVYAWVNYLLGGSPLTLSFVYVVLVLPYVYRSVDTGLAAIDLRTLSEAARGLGAGWGSMLCRVVLPNIRSALLNAALLSVSLVLGEFTLANLLNYPNLQTEMNQLGQADAGVAVAAATGSLLLVFGLLVIVSYAGRRRRSGSEGAPR
jgi:putative spermidine/putrescine transport system permease protein